MKNLSIVMLLALIIMSSCSVESKKVIEPLTPEEYNDLVSRDSVLALMIPLVKKSIKDDNIQVLGAGVDVTWGDIIDKRKFIETFKEDNEASLKTEWDSIEKVIEFKSDSVLTYWNEYVKKQDPVNYFTVELERTSTDYYEYSGGVKDVYMYFKITPLVENIEVVSWDLVILPKGYDFGEFEPTVILEGLVEGSSEAGFRSSSNLSKTAVHGRYEASYSRRNLLSGSNTKRKKIADYYCIPRFVIIDGKTMTKYEGVPESMELYLKSGIDVTLGQMLDLVGEPSHHRSLVTFSNKKASDASNEKYPEVVTFIEALTGNIF